MGRFLQSKSLRKKITCKVERSAPNNSKGGYADRVGSDRELKKHGKRYIGGGKRIREMKNIKARDRLLIYLFKAGPTNKGLIEGIV